MLPCWTGLERRTQLASSRSRASGARITWVFERRSACSAVHRKRLRCENELGSKMVKWIAAIELVHRYADLGAGEGGYNEDHEFYGYRVPI